MAWPLVSVTKTPLNERTKRDLYDFVAAIFKRLSAARIGSHYVLLAFNWYYHYKYVNLYTAVR